MRHVFRAALRVAFILAVAFSGRATASGSVSTPDGLAGRTPQIRPLFLTAPKADKSPEQAKGSTTKKPSGVPKKLVPLPPPDRIEISVPYPNAGMYLRRGIYGSFAGGASREADSAATKAWKDPLFQWQGEVGYFYTDWFSGGVGFRINAGAPSDSQQSVTNRYFLLTRFHKAWPRAAGYLGMNLGVDDVNFSLTSGDTLSLSEPFRETNAGLGFEAGGGWKFSRLAGATLGQRMDVSLVRQSADNPNRALNFTTQPGLAIDMVRVHPVLGTNVKAFYLLTELQFGQTLTEQGDWTRNFAWIMGVSVAF